MDYKKLLMPILIVTIPLNLFQDFLVYRQIGLTSDVGSVADQISGFPIKMAVATLFLFGILLFVLKKNKKDLFDIYRGSLTVSVVVAAAFVGLSLLGSFLASGLNKNENIFLLPWFPAVSFLPALSVLCLGLIESIKGKKTEKEILLITLAGVFVYGLLNFVSVHPFTYFADPSQNFGMSIPLMAFDSDIQIWHLVPGAMLFLMCLLYLRTGMVSTISFLFFTGIFHFVGFLMGALPNDGIGYLICALAVTTFTYKIVPKYVQ